MDLSQYEPLSREEEIELVKRGQAGDIEARNKVVMAVSRMAWSVATKYSGRNYARANELFDEIIATLCQKFHVFDVSLGNRFITWAIPWMYQVCLRERMSNGRLIRIPMHLQTSEEVGKDDWRGQYIERAKRVSSLDAPIPGMDSYPQAADMREPMPEDSVELMDRQQFVRLVISKLNERYRQIMEGRSKGLTLKEMGVEMGITRERVRQLETKAIRQFMRHAEIINKPILREVDEDICRSNRFQGTFQKARQTMNDPSKPKKKDRLRAVLTELGQDVKAKVIKEMLAAEGYKIWDADICRVKRELFGKTPKKRPQMIPVVKSKPIEPAAGGELSALKTIKTFAQLVGGISRLHELTTFLMELVE